MYEQILENNKNYVQKSFSVKSFANKAKQLCGEHRVVIDSINYLDKYCPDYLISRTLLDDLWRNKKHPVHVKILVTFWWGNLSHKNQAPLFYKKVNLDKMLGFQNELTSKLTLINSVESKDKFKIELSKLYNEFKLNTGKYKMKGINTAFFTKVLQFGIKNDLQPIIADKWSTRAVLSDMISQNFNYRHIFNVSGFTIDELKVSFVGSQKVEFEKYYKMIEYFKTRSIALQIEPLKLEEIMFGISDAMSIAKNPRVVAQRILIDRPG